MKYQLLLLSTSQSIISRILPLLSTDTSIRQFPPYSSLLRRDVKTGGVGYWLINHVLSNRVCYQSPTWYILPEDYWSMENIQHRFGLELAYIDASITGIKVSIYYFFYYYNWRHLTVSQVNNATIILNNLITITWRHLTVFQVTNVTIPLI